MHRLDFKLLSSKAIAHLSSKAITHLSNLDFSQCHIDVKSIQYQTWGSRVEFWLCNTYVPMLLAAKHLILPISPSCGGQAIWSAQGGWKECKLALYLTQATALLSLRFKQQLALRTPHLSQAARAIGQLQMHFPGSLELSYVTVSSHCQDWPSGCSTRTDKVLCLSV